jgi:transcription elongation factor Elf1
MTKDAEIARLRAWVKALQEGATTNCSTCGYSYEDEKPEALSEHAEDCPMRGGVETDGR